MEKPAGSGPLASDDITTGGLRELLCLADGDGVRRAAAAVTAMLADNATRDWSVRAGALRWSVAEVVSHLMDVCGCYAVHLALASSRRLRFDLVPHPGVGVAEQVATLDALAEHLAQVIDRAPPQARAWHRYGMADPAGFAAMACDELLVHGSDIAEGWAEGFEPDRELCRLVLARLFPWATPTGDPWHTLRWANGRIALPGQPRLAPDWVWWSAPLAKWDGRRPAATI
jgi:hypothetical protein